MYVTETEAEVISPEIGGTLIYEVRAYTEEGFQIGLKKSVIQELPVSL